MTYFITFLEGIITFISPCLLPLLPAYISFIAGQDYSDSTEINSKKTIINSLGFVLGFTIIFVLLGAFAGTLGKLLNQYNTAINIISGIIIIFFGLNFLGVFRIPILNNSRYFNIDRINTGFKSSLVFGIVFSISWTPCVGTFLGSALAFAASQQDSIKGIIMLLFYSLGLGIPFIISAFLINKLQTTFNFIKKHYKIINIISGVLLILLGILVATGGLGYLWRLL